MTTDTLDPLIHSPARLRVVATLAALPARDRLSLARLQHLTGLTRGHLTANLRTLEDAGYVQTEKARSASGAHITAALTRDGRTALDRYAAELRRLPPGTPRADHERARPELRVGDADRDAAAAALGEHFAHGRLTLDELDARLDATFTATTQGDLSQATCDLPDVTVPAAPSPFTAARRARAWRGHRPGGPPS